MVHQFLHIKDECNHIFLLQFQLLNEDFLMLFFDQLKLLEIIHLFFLHLVFPSILKIVLHMKINFLHIFFALLHIKYQMLMKISLNQIAQLLQLIYLLVFLNLYFLNYVLLHLLLIFYHS